MTMSGYRGLQHASLHDLRRHLSAIAPDHPLAQYVAANHCEGPNLIERCRAGRHHRAELETADKIGFDRA